MKKILFVCSGNTCRSPMAMALFNDMAEKNGVDALGDSAGMYTRDGLPYNEKSVTAMKDEGIPLEGCSKQITEDMLRDSDAVFGLTHSLSCSLIAYFPKFSDKIYDFPVEVADPFGGDLDEYKRALGDIKDGMEKIMRAIKDGKI